MLLLFYAALRLGPGRELALGTEHQPLLCMPCCEMRGAGLDGCSLSPSKQASEPCRPVLLPTRTLAHRPLLAGEHHDGLLAQHAQQEEQEGMPQQAQQLQQMPDAGAPAASIAYCSLLVLPRHAVVLLPGKGGCCMGHPPNSNHSTMPLRVQRVLERRGRRTVVRRRPSCRRSRQPSQVG